MKKWLLVLVALIMAITAGCSMEPPEWAKDSSDKSRNKTIKVGFSVSTLNNPFFVTLKKGAEKKAKDSSIELIAVDAQNDAAKQTNDVEDLIQKGVDVVVINPTDSDAVASAVSAANAANIPVITVDRVANSGKVVSHIASNNVEGGSMAGDYIRELVGEGANVAELEGIPGSSAARERGKGFHKVADKGLKVVAKQAADFDRAKGLSVMENILQANNDIKAVFAHNDEMALGALEALKSAGKTDVVVVGFDATDDAVKAVNDGRMTATVAQKPELIGEKAMETARQVNQGKKVEKFIPIELELIKKK
ncbi:ribose ABC transporter substrate-binding protein RbsB [Bacillus pseudomycoides]|uniref:ribose ABC transporter substrate-binding protein RbsB n=1 Tax=Bacillus pseudomycoides TaxID=64104 RepID=UPI000BEBC8EC|nr:ribose ABC transporter substrate-binding protein RbsB [Bacillus pseudomycoides]MED4652831.1 ribose ABC transporter substrate-binding protein RbsB [Bacillus pseudomycoides]PEE04347.1 ribose ABC transporter substrate-binding protein RbsB [Bacillus pseudomycoides]PEM75417.1 ribose ABC transporter substrate-binding protein RbsB [Bacillus pseudomycoides]